MVKHFLFILFLFPHLFGLSSHSTVGLSKSENHYEVTSIVPSPSVIVIQADYKGSSEYYQNPENPVLLHLKAEIFLQSDFELRVRIKDSTRQRFEIPEADPYPHDRESHYIYNQSKALYEVQIESRPFSFRVIRIKTKEVIFNTQYFNFIYSDRYLEFSSTLPSKEIFGIGERVFKLKLQIPGVYTIWDRDLPATMDDGESGSLNTYGLYPLYLARERTGYFHMVYLRNSNGMDIFLNNTIIKDDSGKYHEFKTITYKVTGGIIDFKFFLGGESRSPEEVVKMYHVYLGGYTLQPFWSFGFHQCRWGYRNLSMLNSTLWNYHSSGMPLDTIWMDIDYMVNYTIFTIDEERYNLTELKHLLEDFYQKRLVLIIDPGVAVKPGYIPYDTGLELDIFIKNMTNDPLLACVWPGQTHFPDFTNKKTQGYWSDMFDLLSQKVNFSGIWLDMNELSNFADGEVGIGECGLEDPDAPENNYRNLNETYYFLSEYLQNPGNMSLYEATQTVFNILNQNQKAVPPAEEKCGYTPADYFYVYSPGNTNLDHKTLCLNALHEDGSIEYDMHNFNGFLETMTTYNYLKERRNEKQPFILSRSTAPGSGKFTTHWTGDNVSTFKWMMLSISGLVNFNIVGIPNVGADICGFASNTTEELCSRWMQLGALYPFSRNHNTLGALDQDPFAFGPTLVETSMKSLKLRYSLLKYYYSLFVRNKGVGTVMRPLFFEFPNEKEAYTDDVLDREFLIGNSLLVTPVLEQGVQDIRPYFPGPKTVWYDIKTGRALKGGRKHFITNFLNDTVPLFLRSGRSIYRQNVENVTKTDDLGNVFYFSVGMRQNKSIYTSKGEILACENYHDYEKLEKCLNGDCMLKLTFKYYKIQESSYLLITMKGNKNGVFDDVYLRGVELYGLQNLKEVNSKKLLVRKLNALKGNEQEKIGSAIRRDGILDVDFGMAIGIRPNERIIVKFN